MIIKCFEIERTVYIKVTISSDGVAQTCTILEFSTANPCILTSVRSIGIDPIKDRQLVERQLIRGRNLLLIVKRSTPVAYTLLHRVLPSSILIRIQIFINRCIRFLNLCTRGRLEIEVEIFGKVPTQGEITIPQELFREG